MYVPQTSILNHTSYIITHHTSHTNIFNAILPTANKAMSSYIGLQSGVEKGGSDKFRMSEREEAFQRLYQGVDVKARRYRLRTYNKCFIASEAVDFMVESGWAASREEAVSIGRELQTDFNMFEHVVEPDIHLFKDEILFFKFNSTDESTSESSPCEEGYRCEGPSPTSKHLGLNIMREILREGVPLKYNFNVDKECFTANSAVDFMVSTGLASSRDDAVEIGLALEKSQHGCLRNVKGVENFADAKLYYVFESSGEEDDWREQLLHAREVFCSSVKVADRAYHLKIYKECFTGTEAVDVLLNSGVAASRRDAVLFGRELMYEYNLFQHVANDHEFEDADYFYRFSRLQRESSRV